MAVYRDFSGRNVGVVERFESPADLRGICEAVRRAEGQGLPVHAAGAKWAFSAPAYCNGVVLEPALSPRRPEFPAWLQALTTPPPAGRAHVAVEAAIRVHDLDLALAGQPRLDLGSPFGGLPPGRHFSLLTHGGAGGQSLAGAFTTGTHGGDLARGAICDSVRALIVVGSRGTVRLVQRHGAPVLDEAATLTELRNLVGPDFDVLADSDADSLEAMLVSVGRFGVFWAAVIEVQDDTGFVIAQRRARANWSTAQAEIRDGAVLAAERAADGFLMYVFAPTLRGGDRDGWRTTARRLPESTDAGPVFGLPPGARNPDIDELGGGGGLPALPLQAMCADHLTPELQQARALLLIGAAVVAGALPFPLGYLAAAPLMEAAASLGRIGPGHRLGDVVTDVLNLFTRSGLPQVLEAVEEAILGAGQSEWLPENLTGPQRQPWLVHGGRARITDGFDYTSDCYRGDSIEIFFPADRLLADRVGEVFAVLDAIAARGTPIGAYVSLRFIGPSQALLALGPAPTSCAIEISMLRGLEANSEALTNLQDLTRRAGGRVHWGQWNTLTPADVEAAYGGALTRWRNVLARTEEGSTTFSTPFSTAHGLEAPRRDAWAGWEDCHLAARSVSMVASTWGQPAALFAVDDSLTVQLQSRPSGAPAGGWRQIQPGQVPADVRPAVVRGADHKLHLFCRRDDRLHHLQQREVDLGSAWSDWTVHGGDHRIRYDPAPATWHDGRLEVFCQAFDAPPLVLHAWDGPFGWSGLDRLGTLSTVGAPVACGRQHLEGVSVTDQMIVVAAAGEQPDVAAGTLMWTYHSGGWSSWFPLQGPDGQRMVASGRAGPLAVNVTGPGMRPHVLAINARRQLSEIQDEDRTVALTWQSWQDLPSLPGDRLLDADSPLAVGQAQSLWVFAVTQSRHVMTIEWRPGAGWQNWIDLGGDALGAPAAGELDDGRVEVVVRPTDGSSLRARRQTAPGSW